MKMVPLTAGFVALVDDEDFEKVSQYKWQAVKSGHNTWYAQTRIKTGTGQRKSVRMHKFLFDGSAAFIDHIDHNGLNNTRANLREVTKQQNRQNSRKLTTTTSSLFKGVCWKSSHQKWCARIQGRWKDAPSGLLHVRNRHRPRLRPGSKNSFFTICRN